MKTMRKIAASIICMCMAVLMVPAVAHAAGAELRFSDPSTTVGATFEITAKLTSDGGIESSGATLTYDSSYLKFVSGDSASGGDGQIQLTGAGGGASEISWTLKFQALKEGTAKVEISSASGEDSDGDDLQITQGNSTVTIGPGDPSLITGNNETAPSAASGTGAGIEVNGTSYTISNDFSEALIPEGFTKTELAFEGGTYQATVQEGSGKYAVYLEAASGEKDFFLYDPDDGKFAPFEQISIAQDRYIVLLSEDKSKSLPSNFQKTSLTVNGKEFPAWQNTDNSEYYAVYALNSDGKKAFYQYDSVDGTYQRFTPEETSSKAEKSPTSFLGKLVDKLKNNLDKFLIGVWAVFLIMLIVLIVVAIKLRHRNDELDDLYDEYGIDLDEDEDKEAIPVKKNKNDKRPNVKEKKEARPSKKKVNEDDFYDFEDEDDDFNDLEYEEDDIQDEYEEYSAYEDDDYDDGGDIDDLDEMLNARVRKPAERPKRKEPQKRSHQEEDDTFKMDIIDLD